MITGILSFIFDCVVGDPRTKFHPVVLIGRLISGMEKLLYHENDSPARKMAAGGFMVVCVLLFTFNLVDGIIKLVGLAENKYISLFFEAFLLSFTISPNSLAAAGRELYELLLDGNLEQARFKVGWIVGRDTDKLTSGEVSRATIETIAENTVDGVIAPLFFFAIGGVPLAFLYRAANTMDSMVGYRNQRYLYYGRAAARLDDVLSYIPARITGILFVVSAYILGFDGGNAWHVLWRDASKHPSPNGGWAEAPAAGAMGIRLGGYNSYFGVMSFREYMGDPVNDIAPEHIMQCIRLMLTSTVLFLAGTHVIFELHKLGVF